MNDFRKCKCCGERAILKKCFMRKFTKEEKCSAWKLWYDKNSQILCDICNTFLPDSFLRMKDFNFKEFRKKIDANLREITRSMRYQIWYLLDLGIIDIEMFR